jgi:hypothetical protein
MGGEKMNNRKQRISTKVIGAFIVFASISLVANVWAFERRSSNAKSVRVDVVPVQLSSGKPAKFEIRMTTHSVELSNDMVAVSTLKDDQGREYRALVWNGSPPGGHHRSGELEFSTMANGAKSVTLYLKNISGVSERIFEWKFEQ